MVEIEKTAYPRFAKYKKLSDKILQTIYTPTQEEILLAEKYTKDPNNKLKFLILLKSFQKLGYFLPTEEVPSQIKVHIAVCLQSPENVEANYSNKKTFHSHKQIIRTLLLINPFDQTAQELAQSIGMELAYRINNLPDIINGVIEELIYQRYELPAFSTLCKIAGNCRITANNNVFKTIGDQISEDLKKSLEELTKITANNKSGYNTIKLLPKRPTINNLSDFIAQHSWVLSFGTFDSYLSTITKSKITEIVKEAKLIDVNGLKDLNRDKRIGLIVCLLYDAQTAGVDNLVKMLCKIISNAHKQAKRKLDQLRNSSKWKMVDAIELLSDLIDLIETNDPKLSEQLKEKVDSKGSIQDLKNLCAQMIAFAKQDHLFLVSQCISKIARNVCFRVLHKLELNSATSDTKTVVAIKFMLDHANHKGPTLNIGDLDLSFMPDAWQKIIFAKEEKQLVIKEHFEACMLSKIANAFRAGDLITINSELFAGYQAQLLSKEECKSKINDYCNAVNISATGKEGVQSLKEKLLLAAKQLDDNYPNIKGFTVSRLENCVTFNFVNDKFLNGNLNYKLFKNTNIFLHLQ